MSFPSFEVEQELTADQQYIKGVVARAIVVGDLVSDLQVYLERVKQLTELPQAIEIKPGLFVDRDMLINQATHKIAAIAQELAGRAKQVV